MTRPVNIEAGLQEQRLAEAREGVNSKKYKSAAEAARLLKVPYSTLQHRINGRQTRVQSHEDQ